MTPLVRTPVITSAHLESIHHHEGIEFQNHRHRDHQKHLNSPLEAAESLPPPLAESERRELGQETLRKLHGKIRR